MAVTLVSRFRQSMLLAMLLLPSWAVASVLTDLDVRETERGDVALDLRFSGDVPELNGYPLTDPPRLALDLAGAENGLPERRMRVDQGGIEGITALEGSGRTRLVLDLDAPREFRSSVSGDRLTVTLAAANEPNEAPAEGLETAGGPQVEDIDFQRGEDGAGRLIVTFDRDSVTPRVREGGNDEVVVDLGEVNVPDALNQVYDVTDFATPISRITPRRGQGGSELVLATDGPYAMVSSQSEDQLTVEVQPVSQDSQQAREEQDEDYTGERLSLNFQDIEVRAVLATLADFTGLNLVASDSVSGRVTLNLNDVPWDQALDLILQSQGLSSREKGNVIVVAPAGELAELERQELEARDQQETLEPLITEYVEVKYARAEDLAELLRGGDGFGLLTERGRVSVDQRTNTLLIQDTPAQVREIMGTLDRLDVAVRQVQIEARIVIARDTASRELGINWGASSTRGFQEGSDGNFEGRDINPEGLNRARGGLSVDLGDTSDAGTGFSFGYLAGDVLLDLELRALESEGKSQTISQPKIITANQRTATISQGEERAFQSVDGNDNPDTEFKEAELSLEVTPQITPDNRIIMDLLIRNDSFRESEFGGEPPIDTNEIETQVLVDNGQTVVLGGILTTEELRQIAKTPLLGDIPLLGRLFRYTEESNEKVELLVFITPRLLDDGLTVR
ncbi:MULTISPECIES: type IV pilus secretin family protein [unclassified Halomonas]|uniref:type IV pilus secretin family protein n=1 Tax=unclassified Halomonas TaxID=2609666 RepID=UPI0006DB0813|nr:MULTISPECIES: type IV pilus secretin family protein [unclassified Halomonas]KPQ22143.1 MAG: type IVa pilus secretin PilQ [Halomonas sp. HL-93]SBR50999.1 type IV pilus assembly protein PilQ [Halomonas sp. HL-93]SNY97142.1 type IV pilus assembly protein PilQ [Halomonas sp. hl-4]